MSENTYNNVLGSELIPILGKVFEKGKITGIINCKNISHEMSSQIFIKDGHIVYANSTMYRAKFGDLMVKKGIITSKDLNTALRLQSESENKKLIGTILVEMGIVSERVIPNLLYHQIEVVIYEILSWKSSNISFDESNIDFHPDYKRPIGENEGKFAYSELSKLSDSKSFLNTLKSNIEELIKIRTSLSEPNEIPKRILKSYPSQLTFDQRKILRAVDGINSINDIIVLSDLNYFKTYQIVFSLITEKIIGISGLKIEQNIEENKIEEKDHLEELFNGNSHDDIEKDKTIEINEATKYQSMIQAQKEEIKNLKIKINQYEESKILFSDDITSRIGKLSYTKKMLLSSILKNVLDIVDQN